MLLRLTSYVSVFTFAIILGCSSSDDPKPFDCSESDLAIELVSKTNPFDCLLNGTINVVATGGKSTYTYSINGGNFSSSATFNSLGVGNYLIVAKDKNGCEAEISVSLTDPSNTLTADANTTSDTECFGNNGSIEINASGGSSPYTYKLGSGTYGDSFTFASLAPGSYSVSVKDNAGCVFVVSAVVGKGETGTSLAADVKPIIEQKCAISGCHNGTQSPDLRTTSGIRNNASKIKSETQSGSMPKNGSLTAEQKALIACWVDEGAQDN